MRRTPDFFKIVTQMESTDGKLDYSFDTTYPRVTYPKFNDHEKQVFALIVGNYEAMGNMFEIVKERRRMRKENIDIPVFEGNDGKTFENLCLMAEQRLELQEIKWKITMLKMLEEYKRKYILNKEKDKLNKIMREGFSEIETHARKSILEEEQKAIDQSVSFFETFDDISETCKR